MIHVAVSLLRFTGPSEQPGQNSHPPHPDYLLRHSSTGSTFSLTNAHTPALPGAKVFFQHRAQECSHRLRADQCIFDQFSDLLMGVGIGEFVGLIGVQPDVLFATVEDTGGKRLLTSEHTHG